MYAPLDIRPKILQDITILAARHRVSVVSLIEEALQTYLADMAIGLLTPPEKPEPRYMTRLAGRRRRG